LLYHSLMGFSLMPFQFTINISNICNRRCRFCPNFGADLIDDWYLRWFRKQPRLMDYQKFEDFIKKMGLLRLFIRKISFTGRGETLLHPDILKFCQLAERYRIKFTITTNGDKLTRLLEYELSKLDYLLYVRVSLFDVDKAAWWLGRQAESRIRIEFHNETGKHIDGFEDGFLLCTNKGNEKYATMPKDFVTESYCRTPFSFNTLNTDGSMVACITFKETSNVFNGSFWRAWNGKEMREIRRQALKMEIPPHLCDAKNCGVFMRLEKYQKMNRYE
jgi:hypothetical protein